MRVTGSFRKDASVAVVGLSLSEDLIGLIVRLWLLFREIQGLVPNRLVFFDRMGLLSSFSSTARVRPTALSSLLLEDQRAVVVASSLILQVRMSKVLLHLTKLW